jgi:hypothetical protein
VARKLLIFNGAKIIGIGHLDFFDRLSRNRNFSKMNISPTYVQSLHVLGIEDYGKKSLPERSKKIS